jgi:uncharacterized integral membrane protein
MGLLPTYAEVGILATILLLLLKILQATSVGGEPGTAIVFIQEHYHLSAGLFILVSSVVDGQLVLS